MSGLNTTLWVLIAFINGLTVLSTFPIVSIALWMQAVAILVAYFAQPTCTKENTQL